MMNLEEINKQNIDKYVFKINLKVYLILKK